MDSTCRVFTIGALADAAGVNVETIRFYQRKLLLPEPRRPRGTIRRYGESELARLHFIKAAQRIGFSLDEIAELLRLDDGMHCSEARHLAEQKLRDVRSRLNDLQRMETALNQLVRSCGSKKESVQCPLLAALHQD